MRPGVDVISRAQPLPRSAPTDTGVAFMVGPTGTTLAYGLVRSLTDYTNSFGARQTNAPSYDAADAFFREGGAQLHVSSTTGTTLQLAPADLELMTRAELDTLASSKGIDTTGLATKADVIAAIEGADTQAVSTGVQAALDRLTADLGPGQIFYSDPALGSLIDDQTALLAHCVTHNRVALLSPADGTAAALEAAATALRADTNARYGALFAPSAVIPGVVGGTTRSVPYAAIVAGMIGRSDAVYGPNVPAAGDQGQAAFATDLTSRYTDAEYQALNDAGCNMARLVYSGVRTYGWRTVVDPAGPSGVWLNFSNARLNMAIVAQAEAIGEHYVFSQLDGRGKTIAAFGGDLRGMLVPMYESGALYGETADEAFDVNVGPAVNTPTTISNGELHAVIQVRMSPFAEWVLIEIVKVATTQAIAA